MCSILDAILRQGQCFHFNIHKNAAEKAGIRIARSATGTSTRTNASLSNRLLSGEGAIGTNLISIGCKLKINTVILKILLI